MMTGITDQLKNLTQEARNGQVPDIVLWVFVIIVAACLLVGWLISKAHSRKETKPQRLFFVNTLQLWDLAKKVAMGKTDGLSPDTMAAHASLKQFYIRNKDRKVKSFDDNDLYNQASYLQRYLSDYFMSLNGTKGKKDEENCKDFQRIEKNLKDTGIW